RYLVRHNREIAFIPGKNGRSQQRALLIECSEKLIRSGMVSHDIQTTDYAEKTKNHEKTKNVQGADQNGYADTFTTDRDGLGKFLNSLETLNKSDAYPLFMIKPSASEYAMQLVRQVQAMGFDVGYDAMVEDESVSFGQHGQ
ncbi:MAG: hypothetical protein HQK65_15190, partial [Desulfamplus sp.]|nr:hypothetical protein [Desulfamplus sp.]